MSASVALLFGDYETTIQHTTGPCITYGCYALVVGERERVDGDLIDSSPYG
jgi:hypothetical protein